MEILTKILLLLCFTALMVIALKKADERIGTLGSQKKQRLLRSLLYAAVVTPTAYHHAPNTIIAPLHLSTICGNLFYGYEYTLSMFTYGVALPTTLSFFAIWSVLSLKNRRHLA